jgi:hypothetical protein
MTSTQYRYVSLASESSFRLFRIVQPCSPVESDSTEIHLFEADFEDSPAFEAVSYAWGQGLSTSAILCNGKRRSHPSTLEEDSIGGDVLDRLDMYQPIFSSWEKHTGTQNALYL